MIEDSGFQDLQLERQSVFHHWVSENEAILLPSSDELSDEELEVKTPLFIRNAVLILEVEGINGETFSDLIRFPGMSNIHAKGLIYHAGEAQ